MNWDPLIFGEGFFLPLVGFCFVFGLGFSVRAPARGGGGGVVETDGIEIYLLYSFQRGMLICRS